MNSLPCEDKGTTFYKELQVLSGLDKRDKRGKRHDLGIVLLGFTLALLSKRDGNLSSIHRHMKNHYVTTCRFVGILPFHVISRSQLPLVLSSVNVAVYGKYGKLAGRATKSSSPAIKPIVLLKKVALWRQFKHLMQLFR